MADGAATYEVSAPPAIGHARSYYYDCEVVSFGLSYYASKVNRAGFAGG
jgi:hypothetical protein